MKLAIVVVMLMFLYNIGMTIWKARRLTTTEGVLVAGLALTAILYLPALLTFDNYTLSIYYRWWTVHLWVEGVWEMMQGGLLAYLLIRLSGADREVMEKWLYVIVGLTFIAGHPRHGAPLLLDRRAALLAADRRRSSAPSSRWPSSAWRSTPTWPCGAPDSRIPTGWRCTGPSGSAIFSALGAGILGLAHTWPSVNKWTHGTMITADARSHGLLRCLRDDRARDDHLRDAAVLRYPDQDAGESPAGLWAFWLQIAGMFGMTMAFAAAGITQTYLERILGLGYLDTQHKMQVHYLMVLAAGAPVRARCRALSLRLLLPRAPAGARGDALAGVPAADGGVMSGPAPCQRRARSRTGLRHPGAEAPFYLPVGDEVAVFEAAHHDGTGVMLKGPTGCGKTRFVEHMAWRLDRPLVTVACHDDLSASDLTGRWLLIRGGETVWQDGPLTRAARHGAICYLDEVVEARQDVVVVIHPLTDHRRLLPIEKPGELVEAAPGFQLVVSYNPGYQHVLKDLKPSTRQRFVTLEFDFPPPLVEQEVVVREGEVDSRVAAALVELAGRMRRLRDRGLPESPSTRLLVGAARLIGRGVPPRVACEAALIGPLTDDPDVLAAIGDLLELTL